MKKIFIKITSIMIIVFTMFAFCVVFASTDTESKLYLDSYSEEYSKWLELSEEERKNTIEPKKYDILNKKDNTTYLKELNNVFRLHQLLRANVALNYDLRDDIPENVVVRNQFSTNSCWAFATLGMLETHLGLRDKNNSKTATAYDFSEKHMNYATARAAFLNNEINEYGYSRKLSDGGNAYYAIQYLANGSGAINESDLPFEDSEANIDISQIRNQDVQTTLYDTVEFPITSTENRAEIIPQMKEHIANYGGIYAGIHGAEILGDSYNNSTGSIYCDDPNTELSDHAVLIIGWDDSYSAENFNEAQRPSSAGAWIAKNSWGETISEDLSVVRQEMFVQGQTYYESVGYTSGEDIPDDEVLRVYNEIYGEGKVKIEDDKIVAEIGNKGYMYISYEDCNVYKNLFGIEKTTNTKDYENIYQHDVLGPSSNVSLPTQDSVLLANVFTRDTNETEYLDRVSIYTFQEYTCKVFVNPNGTSKNKEDLQEIKLASGATETFKPGYHSIEFAESVALTGDSFVVVIQVIIDDEVKDFLVEHQQSGTPWESVVYNEGESFVATETEFNNNVWTDLATVEDESLRGNLCIKAYTTATVPEVSKTLTQIYIQKQPTKMEYKEGESFDDTGMTVYAKYSDGTSNEITGYTIEGGDNLTSDKTSVTVKYTENGVTVSTIQEITVTKQQTGSGDTQDPSTENPGDTQDPSTEQPGDTQDPSTEDPDNTQDPSTDEPGGTTDTPQEQPTLSSFLSANAVITETKMYFSSSDLTQATSENTVKISGIEIGDESNNYTYYYYISGTQGDNNITGWKETKAVKESDGTYSITLQLKSDELQDYTNIIYSDNLYVYLREVAEINQQTAEQYVTLYVDNQAEPECYIDGVRIGGIEDVLNYGKNNVDLGDINQNKDNTVANGILPYTGTKAFKIILILGIIMFGAFAYIRYKNIDR